MILKISAIIFIVVMVLGFKPKNFASAVAGVASLLALLVSLMAS